MAQTVITYTKLSNDVIDGPTTLKEPAYIDVVKFIGTPDQVTHRFTPTLQNTFLVGDIIVAVWEISMFIGVAD